MLAVDVVAPMLATQAAARHMMEAGRGGRIVNIGSVHIRQAAPGNAAYEGEQGRIESLTRSGAGHGPRTARHHGNCAAPGPSLSSAMPRANGTRHRSPAHAGRAT